jgi:anthranilate synthase/aminodeoxychorismate synthase-like glutamine amidotransferase
VYENIAVVRNDKIKPDELSSLKPSGIIISPGPGRPENAGISIEAVRFSLENHVPLLGVCLGHQVIGSFFGADVKRAEMPVHGKTDLIFHDNTGVFEGCKNPFTATRYHSLIVDRNTVKHPLRITAENREGIVMGIAHESAPIFGVQFHPESFLSEEGERIAANFVKEVSRYACYSR